MIQPLRPGDTAVVLGIGLYGTAVLRALHARRIGLTAIDDNPTATVRETTGQLGAHLVEKPTSDDLRQLFGAGPNAFVPSPGVPEEHGAFAAAAAFDVPTISEFDMARWWDERPIGAVTGTDGKTTVTMLAVAMLEESGVHTIAVGNNEIPLITAIDDPDVDVFVVEASSFRLGHTQRFEPKVAAWLNFGPDHLDVHRDLDSYEQAKAKLWATLPVDGVAIANDTDAVVMSHVPKDRRLVTVGSESADGRLVGDRLVLDGETILSVDELPRSFSHDVTNTLVAAALARELGATIDGIRRAVREHQLLPHRIEFVARVGRVDFYNDSKATVPHAVVTALRSFDRAVLIAGGRNKGLDLSAIALAGDRIQATVAIGEAAAEIESAVGDFAPVRRASTMEEAVRAAYELADPEGVVLLSPGCASYDAYTSYAARGADFSRSVVALGELVEGAPR